MTINTIVYYLPFDYYLICEEIVGIGYAVYIGHISDIHFNCVVQRMFLRVIQSVTSNIAVYLLRVPT